MGNVEQPKNTTRKHLWRELLWRRPIVIIGLSVLFLSTADWLWDETILPRFNWERPKLLALLGWLPWYGWVIVGLVGIVFLIHDHSYKLIYKAENERDETKLEVAKQKTKPLAPSNPSFSPRSYKKHENGRCGLTIANSGYDANDVNIPNAALGDCYILHFDGVFSHVAHREEVFSPTWLEGINGHSSCDGQGLFEMMRLHRIQEVKFGVVSKDGNAIPLSYVDECKITRDVHKRSDGLLLSRTGQKVIDKPKHY